MCRTTDRVEERSVRARSPTRAAVINAADKVVLGVHQRCCAGEAPCNNKNKRYIAPASKRSQRPTATLAAMSHKSERRCLCPSKRSADLKPSPMLKGQLKSRFRSDRSSEDARERLIMKPNLPVRATRGCQWSVAELSADCNH